MNTHTLNVIVCHKCIAGQGITCRRVCPCPADPDKRSVGDHAAANYCPVGKFVAGVSRPEQWEKAPSPVVTAPSPSTRIPQANAYASLWEQFHQIALVGFDDAVERLRRFDEYLWCGDCKRKWLALRAAYPPDLSSPLALFRWSVFMHNCVNDDLGKPMISDVRAAKVHGATHLFPPDELLTDTTYIKLQIDNRWSLGDEIVMTGMIHNLLAAYPSVFEVSVKTANPEVLVGFPIADRTDKPDLTFQFPVNYRTEPDGVNFVEFATRKLAEFLHRPIPLVTRVPMLILTDTERGR